MTEARTVRSGFLRSCERFPDRPALAIGGRSLAYAELRDRAASIAATLQRRAPDDAPPLTAVLGQRSETLYASVLGALLRGHGYVPLNPAFPAARTRAMLERSECGALIVDAASEAYLEQVLDGVERRLVLLMPDRDDAEDFAKRWSRHEIVTAGEFESARAWRATPVEPDAIAYLLFTSGSTGVPKGVMVAHRNVTHFLDVMTERYRITESDRLSQLFDLTFDLSAFDMFMAWESGACLCPPTPKQKLVPSSYVGDAGLTLWFSVPSTAVLLSRLGKLKPSLYPGLRLALFCGEALPVDVIQAFAAAAPNAVLENIYGPTEVTIACTAYRWDPARSPAESELGLVPIGEPYPGMQALVADASLREVAPGESGELLMSGPQVSLGYWKDPDKTAAAFVTPPGRSDLFYRTGDRVRRARDGAPLVYLGRIDNQIKIQGYRVELEEVESILRETAGVEVAIAVGWPVNPSGADGIVAFLGATSADLDAIRDRLKLRLPPYMVPREIRLQPEFPLNANGKVDRKALRAQLESSESS
ncbi:MAG: amino acid adenylation domain-containing protein [Myxococcota bacterium]|jgi:amino acid adenylation domain-containing protein|nr:amino acid adenylation domain-containing protein [Myxococcota bacterium]